MPLSRRIASVLAAAVIPLGVVLVVDSIEQRSASERDAHREAMQEARQVAGRLHAIIDGQRQLNLALSNYFINNKPSTSACSAYARSLLAGSNLYSNIVLMNMAGFVVCGALPWPRALNVSDRYYFQTALSRNGPVIGEVIKGRLSGRYVIDVSEAFSAPDGRAGVVSHVLDLERLGRNFAEGFEPKGRFFVILDRNGVVALSVPEGAEPIGAAMPHDAYESLLTGAPKTALDSRMFGREFIVAVVPVSGTGLHVVFGIDKDLELSDATAALWRNIGIALLAVVLMVAAGWILGVILIRRPVNALIDAANERAKGQRGRQFPNADADTEFGRLGAALNEMAASIDNLLNQKTMLVREVQHRVMNSLQLLSSILNLQSRSVEAPIREHLRSARERIDSMGIVYRHLYHSGAASTVKFGDFLRSFCTEAGRAYMGDDAPPIAVDAVDINLPVQTALTLALTTHELITNACKHAYPAGHPGPIEVRLTRDATHLTLSVADRGVGLPEAFSPNATKSLGMTMIGRLTEQFRGRLEVERGNPGTIVRIILPIEVATEATAA